ncbi:MAG: lipopolysaccharide export system permease protein [Algoriphagus sp.]|jgi:lipopolysaccharide export system permease protein
MSKIDRLVIRNFLGPFILTTVVVVFIFLLRFLMLYFEDFVGKDLGLETFMKLFGYFSLITVPTALPLSTLLAALMSFGNLGEHTELTALKAAGIPVSRIILPVLFFSVGISLFSFVYNDKVTPWANLKGYSLLWDIRTTKVALNIQEGVFYREIPGYSIKAQQKFQDNETMKGIMIYNHSDRNGNRNVTVADSGRMYMMYNDSYLVFELFNGYNYAEYRNNSILNDTPFMKNKFKKNRMIFSMESFNLKRTSENQFKYHAYMKNINELEAQIDSSKVLIEKQSKSQTKSLKNISVYQFKEIPVRYDIDKETKDSSEIIISPGPWVKQNLAKLSESNRDGEIWSKAKSSVQSIKSQLDQNFNTVTAKRRDMYSADVERWHNYTYAMACLAMFIIGASLGTIIKKGGFGLPVLIAISFFILYYVMMQLTDKNAREGIMPVGLAVWIPDIVLLIIGGVFLNKATKDARLFDLDIYHQFFDKLKSFFLRVLATIKEKHSAS